MPSLETLLLTLASLGLTLPTALAAPTTTPPPATALLSKRATYHPSTTERDDYCGEAVPTYSYGPSAPLAADCQGTWQAYPGPGYWVVSAAETAAAAPDGWVRLVASGTCAFEVRWSWTGAVQDYRFGTNDLGFYVRSHASQYQAQDGRVSVKSGVSCSRTGTAGVVGLEWRVVHS